jgi:hypothetical protein
MGKEGISIVNGAKLPDLWRSSGMTQEEFARVNNISVHKLRYWYYKQRKGQDRQDPFIELGMPVLGQGFTIRYPNGVELSAPVQTPVVVLKALVNY